MFGPKTKIEHLKFRYNAGICIIKYVDNNVYHSVDICLWNYFDSSRQITINSKFAKKFFNQIKEEKNQNLSALEKLIKKHFI